MASVRVEHAAFDVGAEIASLLGGRTDVGGIGCFVGVVRADAGGSAVTALTLEHYPGMTEAALAAIASEAERRWPLLGCHIVHRIGRLAAGEPIVLVLAASAHRSAALEATAFLMDWLKTDAPFWKKESVADGTERWVEARVEDTAAAERWQTG